MKYNNMILVFVLIFLIGIVSAGTYYKIDLYIDGEEVEVTSVDVVYSRFPLINPSSGSDLMYNVELKNNLGDVIFEEEVYVLNFQLNETIVDGEIVEGETIVLDEFETTIYFPYSEETSTIVIKKDGLDVLTVEDSPLLKDSSNKLESEEINEEKNKNRNEFIFPFYLFLVLLIVVLSSVILYFYFVKKKK